MSAIMKSAARLSSRMAATPKSTVAPRLAMPRPPLFMGATTRAFSVSVPEKKKTEVIKETEVPVSVYQPDAKGVASANSDHFSIPVEGTQSVPALEIQADNEKVIPLTQQAYRAMSPTMQKMSVMDKVIVVTG